MQFNKLHHVSLMVYDLEESLKFYQDILGLNTLPRPSFPVPGAWIELADGRQLHIIETDEKFAETMHHFALKVDKLEQHIEHLEKKGVQVSEIRAIPDTTIRQCFFRDPSGNMIELNESSD